MIAPEEPNIEEPQITTNKWCPKIPESWQKAG
jgi:hypothetical protein